MLQLLSMIIMIINSSAYHDNQDYHSNGNQQDPRAAVELSKTVLPLATRNGARIE